ncbi:MAG TPA: hypothetical protein VH797_07645 [Nitrososphaeraceae archaeon]|jgi:hypothetical protein
MKIIDIEISKDRQLEKRDFCDSYHEIATKLVKYQAGDSERRATRIERYCHKHFELIIK